TTMRNYRYDYIVRSEYRYTAVSAANEEMDMSIGENLVAKLEEDFDIFEMDYSQFNSGTQMIVKLRTYAETEERVVTFEIKSDPPVTREFKFPTSESIHLYLGPLIFRLRQNGSLAQPSRLRERALHPGLEDPVSVSCTAKALTTKDVLGKQVKVSEVQIEGWDRGALAPISHIWVDKYGRIVLAESPDRSISMTMMKDQFEAQGSDKSRITQRDRKDPFSKAQALEPIDGKGRIRPGETGPDKGKPKDLVITKDKIEATLDESRKLVVDLQDQMQRQLFEEARLTYLKILANYKGLYAITDMDHVKRTEVDKLKEDAERLYGGVARLKVVIAAKVDRVKDLYENDNLEGIDREIAELEAMKTAPELFRSEDGQAELEQALRAVKKARERTVARIELGKKVLSLSGTMTATEVVQEVVKLDLFVSGARVPMSQPVSVRRTVSWAVINDEAYREGETMLREGVKILKIHRHAVEVEYKEEVRQVVLTK
ncbi:MAG TPA: hypothetical protein VFC86_14030, partial [Planctomycetota bacterium]|nr:hypothetical protein [Planctomycetota bacterium]